MSKNPFLLLCCVFSINLFIATSGCDLPENLPPITNQTQQGVTVTGDFAGQIGNRIPVADRAGFFSSVHSSGLIDKNNSFFQDLGTNGRRCVSCHLPFAGWTITPDWMQLFFDLSQGGQVPDDFGFSAIFRTNDGSTSPNADVSTLNKRRKAYKLLLKRGLIRVGLPIPTNAEFELIAVDDPYHFATANELSLFRRPLPVANLKFDSTVMWDGRENVPGVPVTVDSIRGFLLTQASDATVGHAQGNSLTDSQKQEIADFQLGLASAQIIGDPGNVTDNANGGPDTILATDFHIGINDNFGDPLTSTSFTSVVFNIFDGWADATNEDGTPNEERRSVARGQTLFNTHPIAISGVSGINDETAFGKPTVLMGTCTSCHDTPNVGNHSVPAPLNIGLVDASRRTPDMPLYTLRNKTTGETVQVTDPGRAMVDGKWSHIGRFKGPMLRNLAPRAPYFHNGFAKSLEAVIDFYDGRFGIGFTDQEKTDLAAFLRAL